MKESDRFWLLDKQGRAIGSAASMAAAKRLAAKLTSVAHIVDMNNGQVYSVTAYYQRKR